MDADAVTAAVKRTANATRITAMGATGAAPTRFLAAAVTTDGRDAILPDSRLQQRG